MRKKDEPQRTTLLIFKNPDGYYLCTGRLNGLDFGCRDLDKGAALERMRRNVVEKCGRDSIIKIEDNTNGR